MRRYRTAMPERTGDDRDGIDDELILIPINKLIPLLKEALQPTVSRSVRDSLRQQSLKELYTPAEAAEVLSFSRSQVYKLVNQKILSSTGEGRSVRIPRQSIDDYIESNMIAGEF